MRIGNGMNMKGTDPKYKETGNGQRKGNLGRENKQKLTKMVKKKIRVENRVF